MSTKLSIWTGVVAILALAVFAPAAQAQVVGSKHDLSSTGPTATTNVTRVCVFCHTPHQAAAAAGQYPLWNHDLSATASYGVYSSVTMNATPTDIGLAVVGSASVSSLCMSCHDGTVSVAQLWNAPNENPILDNPANITITASANITAGGLITGNPNVGTDLTNDHPVNFDYDNALFLADGELNDPASGPVSALLFGGVVECASCHDPHDNTNPPFMVMDNTNSALCTTCHIK